MSAMGVKIDKFDVPVCNSFQAKILNDQLCYEVNLNNFSDTSNIENELKLTSLMFQCVTVFRLGLGMINFVMKLILIIFLIRII